jgi:mycothiol synthase
MIGRDQIDEFLDALTRHDGFAPFSDAKLPIEPDSGRVVTIAEGDSIAAMGTAASHTQSDGSLHWELETATHPGMRFPEFEAVLLESSLALVDGRESFSVWSRRSSFDAALERRGFERRRVLDLLVVDLPLSGDVEIPAGYRIRPFIARDVEAVVAVNRAAFTDHPEAGGLDTAEMQRYRSEPWFDAEGLLVAEHNGIVGFCWTRVHRGGDGEIFRIAVDTAHQGKALGATLLKAGFSYLARRSDVERGVLWVDRSNTAAVALYRSFGMQQERSNSEFTPG